MNLIELDGRTVQIGYAYDSEAVEIRVMGELYCDDPENADDPTTLWSVASPDHESHVQFRTRDVDEVSTTNVFPDVTLKR